MKNRFLEDKIILVFFIFFGLISYILTVIDIVYDSEEKLKKINEEKIWKMEDGFYQIMRINNYSVTETDGSITRIYEILLVDNEDDRYVVTISQDYTKEFSKCSALFEGDIVKISDCQLSLTSFKNFEEIKILENSLE